MVWFQEEAPSWHVVNIFSASEKWVLYDSSDITLVCDNNIGSLKEDGKRIFCENCSQQICLKKADKGRMYIESNILFGDRFNDKDLMRSVKACK